jgi:hypothetical protein
VAIPLSGMKRRRETGGASAVTGVRVGTLLTFFVVSLVDAQMSTGNQKQADSGKSTRERQVEALSHRQVKSPQRGASRPCGVGTEL